jgi:hypothetical protein
MIKDKSPAEEISQKGLLDYKSLKLSIHDRVAV